MQLLNASILFTILFGVWLHFDTRRVFAYEMLCVHRDYLRFCFRDWRSDWKTLFAYIWRLTLFPTISFAFAMLALSFASHNNDELSILARFASSAILLLCAAVPILLPFWSHQFHRLAAARWLALELTPFAEEMERLPNLESRLSATAVESYTRSDDWTAWNPTESEWSDRDHNIWGKDIFPIVFSSGSSPRSLIFARQLDMFMIWRMHERDARCGDYLPFNYLGCKFKIRRVHHSPNDLNWTYVDAEMVM